MCTTPYRPIKDNPPKTAEELLALPIVQKGIGMAYTSMKLNKELIEKRKKHTITSDGSLLGDYVK